MVKNMNAFVEGSLESLDQMIGFIRELSESEYQFIAKPWFDSSIGQHLRHIIDLYCALQVTRKIDDSDLPFIDYDIRRRGAPIETQKSIGLEELTELRSWMSEISESDLDAAVLVSTEIALKSKQVQLCRSTFSRELCFASSHLVHHLAIMAAVAKMAGKEVDPTLGLAPATATFVREGETAVCAH